MKKITIRVPIWNYNNEHAIGIKAEKVTANFQISISYKDKNGQLLYPDTYFMTKEEIQKFERKLLGGMNVYIIPIRCLKIKEK
jgi:hypothetical protein